MILVSGCFDGLHWGHCAYFHEARRLLRPFETFVIAVAPDEYIRSAKHRAPRWSLAQRMGVLMLHTVRAPDTDITSHGPSGAASAIISMRPRLFIKGDDWCKGAGLPDDVRAACELVDCKIVFVNSGSYKHTSDALSTHQ